MRMFSVKRKEDDDVLFIVGTSNKRSVNRIDEHSNLLMSSYDDDICKCSALSSSGRCDEDCILFDSRKSSCYLNGVSHKTYDIYLKEEEEDV